MATSITRSNTQVPSTRRQTIARPRAVIDVARERSYVRFYAAAVIGLVLGGLQGIIQRIPPIAEWLYAAGYGGHLITNLAQSHIIMVGAGTLTVTATFYYLLPRILNRPIYSTTLTNLSFYFTVTGVYSFYFVMLIEGTILGSAVVHGIDYDTARRTLGIWYDLPTGIAGALMGIGYWLFVANIYLTTRSPRTWKGPEAFIAKYIFLGTTGLFIGTLQGFYQILPWSVDFIRLTGEAGRMIDPVAHAHMNMVCGMAMALMGMCYYFIPRLTGKPIWNLPLARTSFWITAIGVFGFWLGLISLGLIEGNIMLDLMKHASLTTDQAYALAVDRVGIWHNLIRAGFGAIMGVGFWTFITVIYMTFRSKPRANAYPSELVEGDIAPPKPDKNSRFIAVFFFTTVTAMLIGTIQGVIQILPFVTNWLQAAGQAGDMITPDAHAQMNIVASIGFGLMGLVYYVLPRVWGKPWASQHLIRVSFTLIVVGIGLYYLSLLTLGLIETSEVHRLVAADPTMTVSAAFAQARHDVGWAHYFWLIFSNCFIALGYIAYATNVFATLGPAGFRDAIVNWVLDAARLMDRAVNVKKRQQVATVSELRSNAIKVFLVELFAGCIGFLGAGWFRSGRPAFGLSIFFTWFCGWIIFVEWVLAAQSQVFGPDFSFVRPALPLYFGLIIVSAVSATVTYLRRGLRRPQVPQGTGARARVIEGDVLLIEDAPTAKAE